MTLIEFNTVVKINGVEHKTIPLLTSDVPSWIPPDGVITLADIFETQLLDTFGKNTRVLDFLRLLETLNGII